MKNEKINLIRCTRGCHKIPAVAKLAMKAFADGVGQRVVVLASKINPNKRSGQSK
jgi:hypothetical protein